MKLKGKAHKYGADVNTDLITPAPYLNLPDIAAVSNHCMEGLDKQFIDRVKPGDFLVATTNFGCGSSREHAAAVIKHLKISCIIASSFARIFFRNAINIGLPILECAEAAEITEMGDELEVDLATGEITNLTKGRNLYAKPYSGFMLELIEKGGLINFTRERIKGKGF
jgi:3-isopropylmalate/(R)-2-methylmalate dehydratase small subunit